MSEQKFRYPGAQPFETNQEHIFFGRENDAANLYRLIKLNSLIVLYGKSGLGKSSLLNAGIIPRLNKDVSYVPLRVRFNAYNPNIEGQKMPLYTTQKSVRNSDKSASTFLDKLIKDEDSLWHDIKEHHILLEGKKGIVLIFDQFEELFSYPAEEREIFRKHLSEALYTKVPQRYWDVLEADEEGKLLNEKELALFQQEQTIKVVFAIRSDRLHLLNEFKDYLPNILKNCFELMALDRAQSERAILLPAAINGSFSTPIFSYEEEAVNNIIDFLTHQGEHKIESTQLQILCHSMEEKVIAKNTNIITAADTLQLEELIENYYFKKIALLDPDEQLPARRLIEEGLIFEEEERRLSLYESLIYKTYAISPDTLFKLVDSHLLRAEPSTQGGFVYELSHDALVAPVLEAKKKRIEFEKKEAERLNQVEQERLLAVERKKRKRARQIAIFMSLLAALATITGISAFFAFRQANDANKQAESNYQEAVGARQHADSLRVIAEQSQQAALDSAAVSKQQRELALAALSESERNKLLAEFREKEAMMAKDDAEVNRNLALQNLEVAQNLSLVLQVKTDSLTFLTDSLAFLIDSISNFDYVEEQRFVSDAINLASFSSNIADKVQRAFVVRQALNIYDHYSDKGLHDEIYQAAVTALGKFDDGFNTYNYGHLGKVTGIIKNEDYLITVGEDGQVLRQNFDTKQKEGRSFKHKYNYNIVEQSNDGKYFALTGQKPYILLYNTKEFAQIDSIPLQGIKSVKSLQFLSERDQFYYLTNDSKIYRYDISTKQHEWVFDTEEEITNFVFGPEGNDIIYLQNGSIKTYALANNHNTKNIAGSLLKESNLLDISISNDKNLIAVTTKELVKIYSIYDGLLKPLNLHQSKVSVMKFSEDDKFLITGGYDGIIAFVPVDDESGEQITIPCFYHSWADKTIMKNWITAIEYDRASNTLIAAYGTGWIRKWQLGVEDLNQHLCELIQGEQNIDFQSLWEKYIGTGLDMGKFYKSCQDFNN